MTSTASAAASAPEAVLCPKPLRRSLTTQGKAAQHDDKDAVVSEGVKSSAVLTFATEMSSRPMLSSSEGSDCQCRGGDGSDSPTSSGGPCERQREGKTDGDRSQEEPQPAALVAIGKNAPVAIHTFSSQFASALSTVVFYPFDVLKTRFMSQDGTVWRQHNGRTYHSIPRSLRAIAREEGVRTMFRGCTVAVCGSVSAWGLYMFFYRELCNATEVSSLLGRSGLSMTASLASSLFSSPIFLIKSRMQLEEATRSSHYSTFWGALRHTVATGGVRSLWRGVTLQLLLVFPNALAIPIYDYFKSMLLRYRWSHHEKPRDLSVAEVCVCSTTTKVLLLTVSHPLVMMKVRLQDQRSRVGQIQYRSVGQTLLTILKTQGVKGMYRGYSTSLIHSLPRSLVHYVVYEKTLNLMCRTWNYQR